MDIQDSNSLPDDTGDASSNPRGNDDSFFIFSPLTLAATAGHSADSDQNSQNSQNSEMATEGQEYLILQANEASEEVDNGASAKKRAEVHKLFSVWQTQNNKRYEMEATPCFLRQNDEIGDDGETTFSPELDHSVVGEFFAFFLSSYGGVKKITASQWIKALSAVQHWTNSCRHRLNLPEIRGEIRNVPCVSAITKQIPKEKKKRDDLERPDLHKNLLRRVTFTQEIAFIEQCYVPTSPSTASIDTLSRAQVSFLRFCFLKVLYCTYYLTKFQVATSFVTQRLTVQRSEFMRSLNLSFGAVRDIEGLGPGPDGTKCEIVITNKGKRNQNGNVEHKTLPPTLNCIFDASAHLGNMCLISFGLLKQIFPSYLDWSGPNSYTRKLVLQSVLSSEKPAVASTVRSHWKKLNDACGIYTGDTVTHQPRIQTQQKLASAPGISGK